MIKVYYCEISGFTDFYYLIETLSDERKSYVLSINDVNRQKQSVLVWKLLERCLTTFHKMSKPCFIFDKNCWRIKDDKIKFSLSHSKDFVAVAIGDIPLGVDVQFCDDKILKLKNKLKHEGEEINDVNELTEIWTKKESLYKAGMGDNFFTQKLFDLLGREYRLTVCSNSYNVEFIKIDKNFLC